LPVTGKLVSGGTIKQDRLRCWNGSQHHSGNCYEWESLSIPEPLPDAFLKDAGKKTSKSKMKVKADGTKEAKEITKKLSNTFKTGSLKMFSLRNARF
jgi:hypothetical protein